MNILENYLQKLNEKEWDENDTWKSHFDRELLKHVVSKNSKTGETEININRHSIQVSNSNLKLKKVNSTCNYESLENFWRRLYG